MGERKNKLKKTNYNVELADEVELAKKELAKVNSDEYNYIATSNHWLSNDEQSVKAREIEKVTDSKKKY